MKIKIVRGTVCDGRVVRPGDIVDASEKSAFVLIRLGKAVEYDGSVDEGLVDFVEKPKKRGRPKKKRDAED